VENNPKEKLGAKSSTENLQWTAQKYNQQQNAPTSRYAETYKTSAPHLTNSIMYVGQYLLWPHAIEVITKIKM